MKNDTHRTPAQAYEDGEARLRSALTSLRHLEAGDVGVDWLPGINRLIDKALDDFAEAR